MGQFENVRAVPRLLEIDYGTAIDLLNHLPQDPETTSPELGVQRSWSGKIETQPGTFYDRLRVTLDGVDTATKDLIERAFDRSLAQGQQMEFQRDPSKVFLLAGDQEYDQRRHAMPRTGSTYTMVPGAGPYGGGGIGVFDADPNNDLTNWVLNGDFQDGTISALPTDWAVLSGSVAFIRSQFFRPDGSAASMAKAYSTNAGFGGTVYQDIELPGTMTLADVGVITFSLRARADRHTSSAATNTVSVYVGRTSDASLDTMVGQFTPLAPWELYRYRLDTTTPFSGETSTTLRLKIVFSTALSRAACYLQDVQIENRDFATGFVARSSVREGIDGSRPAADYLRYLNYLGYGEQLIRQREGGRFAFTIAMWIEFPWSEDYQPALTCTLIADAHEADATPAVKAWLDVSHQLNFAAVLDDGTTATAQSAALTIAMGDRIHVVLSFTDWDGSTSSSGKADIWINGELSSSQSHNSHLAGMGDFLVFGSNPTGLSPASVANVILSDVRIDAGWIDTSTTVEGWTIDDYYSPDVQLDRMRTAWRCYLDQAHKGRPCTQNGNLYKLDLQLVEAR